MSAVKKGYDYQILPPELRYSKEEAEELLDFLRNKNRAPVRLHGPRATPRPTASRSSTASVQQDDERRARAARSSRRAAPLPAAPGLSTRCSRSGTTTSTVSRYLTTAQVAMQMPFASQEPRRGGRRLLRAVQGERATWCICDRKRLASPMGFVCGKPGSGKSFSREARDNATPMLAYPEDEVVIFDPAGEYGDRSSARSAARTSELAAGRSAVHEPLRHRRRRGPAPTPPQLAFKIDAVLALSSATHGRGARGPARARTRSIISPLRRRGVPAVLRGTGRLPVLGDFYDGCCSSSPSPRPRDIALRYERYVKGALLVLQPPEQRGASTNRITNIDLHGPLQNMRVFGMLTALEAVRNRMYANFARGNDHLALHRRGAEPLRAPGGHRVLRQASGRRAASSASSATGHHARTRAYMLGNDDGPRHGAQLRLRAAAQAVHRRPRRAGRRLLDLSAQEARLHRRRRSSPARACWSAGGVRVPITDDFPRGALYDLLNTKPAEVAAARVRRGGARAAGWTATA